MPRRLMLVAGIGVLDFVVLAAVWAGMSDVPDLDHRALSDQAHALAAEIAFAVQAGARAGPGRAIDPVRLSGLLDPITDRRPDVTISVFGPTGALLFRSGPPPLTGALSVSRDLTLGTRRIGRTAVALPRAPIDRQHRARTIGLALLFLCGWPAMAIVMLRHDRALVRRLGRIEQAAGRIAVGDFSVSLPARGQDGVARIEAGFNFMAASLNENHHQLQYMAFFDPVTGLPNRAGFIEDLSERCKDTARGGPGFVVAVLDVDRFKDVNDVFGHAAGDELLARLSLRLRKHLGPDASVGRLSGDEFAVLLPHVATLAAAISILRDTAETVCRPVELRRANTTIHASFSIGIAQCPADYTNPVDLLKATDLALKEAKTSGGGQLVAFKPDLANQLQRRRAIEDGLRDAIEAGTLSLVFHPLVDCRSSRIESVEALLRWQHPTLGPVAPSEFIPVAEQSGLIKPMGLWVLSTACAQLKAWTQAGLADLSIAVNVSVAQMVDETFPQNVLTILEREGVEPSKIVLELTESIFAGPWLDRILSHLEVLRSHGIKIAIDDFGTGYSSLSYVHDLPCDEIKIDRAFVSPTTDSTRARAILVSICQMVRTMGDKTIVAEGIETEAHLRHVVEAGCDLAQGYFLSEPLAGADLVPWWDKRRAMVEAVIADTQNGAGIPSLAVLDRSHAENAEAGLGDRRIEACR